MALYEFQCTSCGRKTEVIQRFSDPPPKKCPHCGGKLAKLLSTPAFQFKGSGFYATDYAKAGAKPEDSSKEKEGEGDSSKSKEAGSAEAGAEAKSGPEADSSKEKKGNGTAAASDASSSKTSNAPSKKKKSAKS